MENEVLALIASFLAMVMVVISYFVKIKKLYLFFQLMCVIFLIVSYFFSVEFFAMVGLSIGFCRTLTFYCYESKGKEAPMACSFIFSAATIASYFIVNYGILKTANPVDILCLLPLVMYAFIFRIRNLKLVRFMMPVPTTIAILYNVVSHAPVFAALSYAFELAANILSILKYHVFHQEKKSETVEENINENS
ncbi:MAG: YgjV family protein [Clostridia bacterium]|nr:YgjV family protein [Clostridia bacterium]